MFNMATPVIPGATGTDIQGTLALLAVIADPKAAKARLDQLLEAATKAQATLDATVKERAATDLAKQQIINERAASDAARADVAKLQTDAAAKAAQALAAAAASDHDMKGREQALLDKVTNTNAALGEHRKQVTAELDARKATLDEQARDLANAQRQADEQSRSRNEWMERATADLDKRKLAVADAEDKNKAEADKLKTLHSDLERRMAQLRQLAS